MKKLRKTPFSRINSLIISLVIAILLVDCGQPTDKVSASAAAQSSEPAQEPGSSPESGVTYAEEQVLRMVYQVETPLGAVSSSNSVSQNSTHPSSAEGLLTRDQYDVLGYALADSFTKNEDGTVYTFHIREGVYWVDCQGNPTDELTAEDFVTSAKYVCEPGTAAGTAFCYANIVAGASEYIAGENQDFDTVGVKALDRYTLEYTLAAPVPYFIDNCVNYVPLPTRFFQEQGERYGTSCESTYYISCYYLAEWEDKAYRTYIKNPHYWDAENVFIERVEMTYNSEAERLEPQLFERGEVDTAVLSTSILDDWLNDPSKAQYVLPSVPNIFKVYFYSFCYAPKFSENDILKDFSEDNYLAAIDNENFRQSLYWGFDRSRTKLTADPYTPELYLGNTISPEGWSSVDGVDYTQMEALTEIVSRKNYSFDEEKALEYKEKAVAELTEAGVTFPVKMPMPYDSGSSVWPNEVVVVKQQLEDLLGADYIEITPLPCTAGQYMSAIRSGWYGFTKISATSSVRDPLNWAFHFMPGSGYTFLDQAAGPGVSALAEEYYELVGAASAINEKSVERYNAFAAAESFLLEHALAIPYSMDAISSYYTVGRVNPLERAKDGNNNFKYMHVLKEPLTKTEYDALYQTYLVQQEEALVNSLS